MINPPEWLNIIPALLLVLLAFVLIRQGSHRKRHDRGNVRSGGPGIDETTRPSGRRRGDTIDSNGGGSGDGGE